CAEQAWIRVRRHLGCCCFRIAAHNNSQGVVMSRAIWSVLALGLLVGCSHSEPKSAQTKPAAKETAAKKDSGKATKVATAEPAAPAASDKLSKAVSAAVNDWAAAWQAKDTAKYLASYSPNFKPEEGSRADWEK